MFRVILILSVFFGVMGVQVFAKNVEPVHSTQGLELSDDIAKSKPSQEQKNEQKRMKTRSRIYIKAKKDTVRQDKKRLLKEKEIEYLEMRLENKKQRLELLNSDVEKGEKE